MADNNISINSETFANMVAAAQFASYENSIARAITTIYDMPAGTGTTVQVPVWGGITANTPADGVAATSAGTATTQAEITLAEHVVYHRITDLLQSSAMSGDVLTQLADQSGRAIAESVDTNVFANFTNFTSSVGAAGADLTPDSILQAITTLRAAKVSGPFYCVLNPKAAYGIKKLLTNAAYGATASALSDIGNSVLGQYYIGSLAGCTILESGLVTIDASDDSIGAVFSPSAIGLATRGAVTMREQYQAVNRATDLVVTGTVGSNIIQNTHGVKLIGDAVIN